MLSLKILQSHSTIQVSPLTLNWNRPKGFQDFELYARVYCLYYSYFQINRITLSFLSGIVLMSCLIRIMFSLSHLVFIKVTILFYENSI